MSFYLFFTSYVIIKLLYISQKSFATDFSLDLMLSISSDMSASFSKQLHIY